MGSVEFKKILCPIDLSEYSSHALKYAVTLAEQFHSFLYVIHTIPHITTFSYTSFFDGNEKKVLEELCLDVIPKNLNYEFDIIKGDDIPDGIIQFAKEKEIDLIVIGSHCHSTIERLLMGSVTEKVVRKSHCGVLITRHPDHKSTAD